MVNVSNNLLFFTSFYITIFISIKVIFRSYFWTVNITNSIFCNIKTLHRKTHNCTNKILKSSIITYLSSLRITNFITLIKNSIIILPEITNRRIEISRKTTTFNFTHISKRSSIFNFNPIGITIIFIISTSFSKEWESSSINLSTKIISYLINFPKTKISKSITTKVERINTKRRSRYFRSFSSMEVHNKKNRKSLNRMFKSSSRLLIFNIFAILYIINSNWV